MCPLLVFPVVHGGDEGVEKSQQMAGTLLDTYHGLEPLLRPISRQEQSITISLHFLHIISGFGEHLQDHEEEFHLIAVLIINMKISQITETYTYQGIRTLSQILAKKC